jgi:23S rRNA pseudouridine1911/1915/1917 synthase
MTDPIFCENLVADQEGIRLDAYLARTTGVSRSRIEKLITDGLVLVNGSETSKKHQLSVGDVIEYSIPSSDEIEAQPENIPLDIFYEDRDIVVVNKPQGMVVHPAPGNPNGTLVNALLFHCKDSLSGINGKLRPGIVHRIDKDTSGLLIVAKNDAAHIALSAMFQNHSFVRKYEAIIYGSLKNSSGTITYAIGRSKKDRKKMAFYPENSPNTKRAVTHYRVIQEFRGYSHVELTLETGRTHQIRLHMLSQSSPVLADPLYAPGRETFGLKGQCLHAKYIEFKHPITSEVLAFESPLPPHFQDVLVHLERRK